MRHFHRKVEIPRKIVKRVYEKEVRGWPVGRLRPLIMNESFARMRNEELGMRNGGAAHKNMEAPRSFDSASRASSEERSP